ncbi:major facilitator superfamily domain-containing protein [Pyronema omphalodes]|nr:major facilitator superfamily domain-containing protein [Pyronema omphalodes]
MDGYDFHSVSVSVSDLAKYYKRDRENIAMAITVTLLFRSVGAIIFGLAGDLYGRKWPMIVNLLLIAVFQLCTAYCVNFSAFLAVRALFGVGMGGIWGLATSMALENMPVEARGLFSGILQQGYALGYLIAAGFKMGIVPYSKHGFKILYYLGAGLTAAVAISRLFFGESKQFVEAKKNSEISGKARTMLFIRDVRMILKECWKRCLYCIILLMLMIYLTFLSSVSHTSQDMYPTYMHETKGFSQIDASKATMLAKTGAILGGTFFGYYSQYFGRRASIIVAAALGACLIPLWILPNSWGTLTAGAFLIQFMIQGAWGIIPIHLNELSPPQFRSSFPGICYQLGNMLASPASLITSTISEHRIFYVDGKPRPNYGWTQALMMSIIFSLVIVWTASGKEQRGSHFELAKAAGLKDVFEEKQDELRSMEAGSQRSGIVGEADVQTGRFGKGLTVSTV